MIKVAVKILLKKDVLDVKGRTLLKLLQKESSFVKECRYGKYIELCLEGNDSKKALEQADQIARNILHNDLVETFELELID